jgi:hypothetical protein
MPLRFSKYDQYLAEQEAAAESSQEESDGTISPDPSSMTEEDTPSADEF